MKKEKKKSGTMYLYKEKKGRLSKAYKWFMKMCVNPKYLDGLHVPLANSAPWFKSLIVDGILGS